MANVILRISAENRSKRTLDQIKNTVQSTFDSTRDAYRRAQRVANQYRNTLNELNAQYIDSGRANREVKREIDVTRSALSRQSAVVRKASDTYKDASEDLRRFKQENRGTTFSFRSMFQTVADGIFIFREFGFWVRRIGQDLIQTGVYMDSLRRSLAIFASDAESADSILENVFELAELPGITIQGASKAVQDLKAINLETELVNRTITEFGNLLALTGDTDFSGILLGFKQIINRQRVSQEELNQIIERSGLAAKALQEAFGFATTEEIQGVVDARGGDIVENFVRPFLDELEELDRFPIDAAATRIKNLQNEFFRLRAELGEELTPAVSSFAKTLTDFLRGGGIDRIAGGFRFLLAAIGPATAGVATFAGARGLGALIRNADTVEAFLRRTPSLLANFARAYGPAIAATAAVTIATALWTQALRENRKARELSIQVNKDYSASLRQAINVLQDGQADAEDLGNLLEKINEMISEATTNRANVGQGFVSAFSPLDDRAVASQIASYDRAILLGEQLQNIINNIQEGRISQAQGVEQLFGFSTTELQRVQREIENTEKDILAFQNALNEIGTYRRAQAIRKELGREPIFGESGLINVETGIVQLDVLLKQLEAEETTLQNIVNLFKERQQAITGTTPTAAGESSTDLSIAIAREEETLRRLRESLSNAAVVWDIGSIQTQTQQSLSRLTELRRRHAKLTIDDAGRLQLSLVELELRTLREIDAITQAAIDRRKTFRDADAKERIARETRTQKAIAASIQRENRRQAEALKEFVALRETLSRREQKRLDARIGALVRQGKAFDVAYRQAVRFFALTDAVSSIPDKLDVGFVKLNISLARTEVIAKNAYKALRKFLGLDKVPDIISPFSVLRGRSVEERFPPGSRGISIEEDQAEVGQRGRAFILEQFNRDSATALQRQQQIVTSIVGQTQQSLIDIINSSGDLWLENLKRVVQSFTVSSLTIIAQSEIQYRLQKFYDDKLTEAKLANIARLQAVTAASQAVSTVGSIGVLESGLGLLSVVPTVLNFLQIGEGEVREISAVQRKHRAERTDF